MAQYQIEKISGEAPREWKSPQGSTIYYYKVKFVGRPKPVSIGKTKLNSLTVGQMVDGTIEESDLQEDKFKAAPMNQGGGGYSGGGAKSYGTDAHTQDSIARSVALKAAVDFCDSKDKADTKFVLSVADDFLVWLKHEDKPEQTVAPFDEFGTPPEDGFGGEDFDTSQIPF